MIVIRRLHYKFILELLSKDKNQKCVANVVNCMLYFNQVINAVSKITKVEEENDKKYVKIMHDKKLICQYKINRINLNRRIK